MPSVGQWPKEKTNEYASVKDKQKPCLDARADFASEL
jgi:hypothetical protein